MTRLAGMTRVVWPCLLLLGVVAGTTGLLGLLGTTVLNQVVTGALINLILVVSLYIFVGNSGIFSFGYLAFAAIGAYAAGILTVPAVSTDTVVGKDVLLPELLPFLADAHMSSIPATLVGGLAAGIAAAIVAVPLMRLNGIAAAIATFAVLIVVYVVANNWQSVTNGSGGIAGVPATTTQGRALAWSLVVIVIAYAFQQTRWCIRLRASREDEVAARSLGIGIYNERRLAFVLSAACAGVGGGVYGQYLGSFTADFFYLSLTFTTIAMLIVGGMTSLTGAVVGTAFLSAAAEGLRRLEEVGGRPGLQEVGFAAILLAALILRPRGITLGRELVWPLRSTGSGVRARRTPDSGADDV
jgi:branched-chain amino acid transport system permease protein